MKFNKEDILKALETITVAGEGKNMVESGAVKNIMTFADESYCRYRNIYSCSSYKKKS